MEVLTTDEIDKAYERIQSLIIKTPLISNERINNNTNSNELNNEFIGANKEELISVCEYIKLDNI